MKKQNNRIAEEKEIIQKHSSENINQMNSNCQSITKQKDALVKEKAELETKLS
jgi:hypothetical protein